MACKAPTSSQPAASQQLATILPRARHEFGIRLLGIAPENCPGLARNFQVACHEIGRRLSGALLVGRS